MTKTREPWSRRTSQYVSVLGLFLLVSLLTIALPVSAQDSAISKGFQTKEESLTPGALVSFEPDSKAHVQLANQDNATLLAGIASDQPLIQLSDGADESQVVVSGSTQGLVSTINGDIKAGDPITASPINGVGMKATGDVQVVGTALADFKDAQQVSERVINDRSGNDYTTQIGVLPVLVSVSYHATKNNESLFVPPILQQVADGVAGREVSPMRVLAGFLIFLVGLISSSVLLYSSVRSSISSIGRNPLSEQAVRKGLFQVGVVASGVLFVTGVAVYLMLVI